MRLAFVNNNRVEKVEELDEMPANSHHWQVVLEVGPEVDTTWVYGPSGLKRYVPSVVAPRQVRLALLATGTAMADVTALFETLTEPTKSQAQIWWEYSIEFRRDNSFLNAIAPSMGFTQEMLDELFILAEKL